MKYILITLLMLLINMPCIASALASDAELAAINGRFNHSQYCKPEFGEYCSLGSDFDAVVDPFICIASLTYSFGYYHCSDVDRGKACNLEVAIVKRHDACVGSNLAWEKCGWGTTKCAELMIGYCDTRFLDFGEPLQTGIGCFCDPEFGGKKGYGTRLVCRPGSSHR